RVCRCRKLSAKRSQGFTPADKWLQVEDVSWTFCVRSDPDATLTGAAVCS
ncbi:Hypothetical predicted protein, partial [Scomber scombrus]